ARSKAGHSGTHHLGVDPDDPRGRVGGVPVLQAVRADRLGLKPSCRRDFSRELLMPERKTASGGRLLVPAPYSRSPSADSARSRLSPTPPISSTRRSTSAAVRAS